MRPGWKKRFGLSTGVKPGGLEGVDGKMIFNKKVIVDIPLSRGSWYSLAAFGGARGAGCLGVMFETERFGLRRRLFSELIEPRSFRFSFTQPSSASFSGSFSAAKTELCSCGGESEGGGSDACAADFGGWEEGPEGAGGTVVDGSFPPVLWYSL